MTVFNECNGDGLLQVRSAIANVTLTITLHPKYYITLNMLSYIVERVFVSLFHSKLQVKYFVRSPQCPL